MRSFKGQLLGVREKRKKRKKNKERIKNFEDWLPTMVGDCELMIAVKVRKGG